MFELRKARRERQLLETQRDILAEKYALKAIKEASNLVVDDEEGWIPITFDTLKGIEETDLETMWQQARKFRLQNHTVQAIAGNMLNFVIGRGVQIDPEGEDDRREKIWKAFQIRNKWRMRQREICDRVWRDGEVFLRWFKNDINGAMMLRFIDPERIKDPSGTYSFGIETLPKDVETAVNYIMTDKGGTKVQETIPAEEIIHVKIITDSNEKRGISFYYGIMPLIMKYEQWLNDRILLNKIRSAVALKKKITGGQADVDKIRNQQAAENNTTTRGNRRQKMLKGGSTITANDKVDWEFMSPNLQASDVAEDGRHIELAMAAAKTLPEYMVTGDASNSNYASTMISESPGVRSFESWQDFFEPLWSEVYVTVLKSAMERGEMAQNDELLEHTVIYPPLIARNLKEETDANSVMNAAGILSKSTWAAQQGLNYDEERQKIVEEDIGTAIPE